MGYRWVIDEGHAWLRVPTPEVESLGVQPGLGSYYDRDYTFLERTVDAALFLRTYALRYYTRPVITKEVVEYPAFVRELSAFGAPTQLQLFEDTNHGNS
jgi:hypothetical protein